MSDSVTHEHLLLGLKTHTFFVGCQFINGSISFITRSLFRNFLPIHGSLCLS